MFNEASFQEMLFLSSRNVNDYVAHICSKYVDLDGNCGFSVQIRIFAMKYSQNNHILYPIMGEASLKATLNRQAKIFLLYRLLCSINLIISTANFIIIGGIPTV